MQIQSYSFKADKMFLFGGGKNGPEKQFTDSFFDNYILSQVSPAAWTVSKSCTKACRLCEHFRLCILRPSNLSLFRFPFQHAARSGGGGAGWIKCGTFWSAPPDLRMRSRMCTLMNSIIQFGSYLCVHCKWRRKWRRKQTFETPKGDELDNDS